MLCGRLILGETLAIYNNTTTENNSLTFNSDGLIVTGNNNTVRINANPTSGEYNNSIFTINSKCFLRSGLYLALLHGYNVFHEKDDCFVPAGFMFRECLGN